MPIAVIISGKLVARTLKIGGQSNQIFRISVPKIFHLQAKNDEVILGFTLFLITLLSMGLIAGKSAYKLLVADFGIDPGQFNALCVLSAFADVTVAFTSFLILEKIPRTSKLSQEANAKEHDQLIEQLGRRSGDDSDE